MINKKIILLIVLGIVILSIFITAFVLFSKPAHIKINNEIIMDKITSNSWCGYGSDSFTYSFFKNGIFIYSMTDDYHREYVYSNWTYSMLNNKDVDILTTKLSSKTGKLRDDFMKYKITFNGDNAIINDSPYEKCVTDFTDFSKNYLGGEDINNIINIMPDYNTIIPINENYSKDKDHVFHNVYGLIGGADRDSFMPISSIYSRDKKNVYIKNLNIPGSNPEYFKSFGDDNYYSKDDKNFYYENQILNNVDKNTFHVLSFNERLKIINTTNPYGAYDAFGKYYRGKRIK